MNIEKTTDLIDFINYEILDSSSLNNRLVFNYFYKCCYKTITELSLKFKNSTEHNLCVSMGVRMFFYVFFVLIIYTNNLKLTIFLSERAILLYSEFILMSRDKTISEELNYVPNISDAISFAYKKTIGPIRVCDLNNNNKLLNVRDVCNIVVTIYTNCFLYNKEIFEKMELIDDKIISTIYNVFLKIDEDVRDYLHLKIIKIIENSNNIEETLILIKIILDSFQKIMISEKVELKYLKKIFESVYDKYLDESQPTKPYNLDSLNNNLKYLEICVELRKSVKVFRKMYK